MHEIDKYERQSSTQRQAARNLTAASSPRIISSQQKNSNNLLQKFSQLDNATSPKIQLSNLTSQQSLVNKQKVKLYTEDFNRHLLLSKIKELMFNQSVSTDKLYAMARIQQHTSSKSPLKYAPTKTRGNNHSAEHYRA